MAREDDLYLGFGWQCTNLRFAPNHEPQAPSRMFSLIVASFFKNCGEKFQ
jgi:hypothetical protein